MQALATLVLVLGFGLAGQVRADDVGPSVPNGFDEGFDSAPAKPKNKEKSMLGVQLNAYYDALSNYDKLNPYGGLGAFTNQTTTGGMYGMQALFVIVSSKWEFSAK